jgi:tRNA pseudouridine55 synthase
VDGFLNLDKPLGLTSHDCVAKLRKVLRLKRIGHAGTLDPEATGVLPIAIGRATRLLQYLQQDKAYRAVIRFGMTTTTDDLAGEILTQNAVPDLTLDAIQAKLPLFQGKIEQIPPNYSAVQVQGKRLYDLARSGQAIEAPVRSVEVYKIEVLDWRSGEFPALEVAITCGSGTYIRSIARDLGAVLGTGATLAKLLRTESSGFSLSNSLTFEQIDSEFTPIAPDIPLSHLPKLELEGSIARRWRQGQKIAFDDVTMAEDLGSIVQIYDEEHGFLGIAQLREDKVLVPQMVYEPI